MAGDGNDTHPPKPPEPDSGGPRYSRRPLPRGPYRPGRTSRPRPILPPPGPRLDPERWWECQDYLFAVDLYNRGYWWECHEVLEVHWRRAGRRSGTGRLLQGLIQLAAANLKRALGLPRAADTLTRKALRKLGDGPGEALGIDLRRLVTETDAFARGRCSQPPRIRLGDLP